MKRTLFFILMIAGFSAMGQAQPRVKTANGTLEGVTEASGIRAFKGIPFAAPPVGNLRWKEPQPVKNWTGVRKADKFGGQAIQPFIWADMLFRSSGKSEDCLYLNVWTPAKSATEKLPVLVYFYGGGLRAGDGSEYRYDGEALAKKGIITLTVNYRLGVFGFLAHPELTKESAHKASGNYGLMDQHAAMVWVKKNIAAFGGDPDKVTIAGESAGSMSVCAQMASPLSKGLFRGAIGESGSMLGNLSPSPLKEVEERGSQFAAKIGANSLADLRKIPAEKLMELATPYGFPTAVDGYFLPETPQQIFATGRQMDIPLLAGWTTAEVNYHSLLDKQAPTLDNYNTAVKKLYGDRAGEILKAYAPATEADVEQVATDLASDRFIAYSTWKFIDLHSKTNGHPVYRYLFAQKRPVPADAPTTTDKYLGATHASDIEYALGNLPHIKAFNWTADDYKASETMQNYFVNFVKNGNPNGDGLPKWFGLQSSIPKVMVIDANSHSEGEKNLKRYVLMDTFYNK